MISACKIIGYSFPDSFNVVTLLPEYNVSIDFPAEFSKAIKFWIDFKEFESLCKSMDDIAKALGRKVL